MHVGLDQVQIYARKAEQSSDAIKEVWELLTTGLQALNEDDPDTAISDGHKAIAKAKTANFGEGDSEGLLLVTRALTSINSRKEGDRLARAMLSEAKEKKDKSMEAKALLAIAEVNADQRGSKKREEARSAGQEAFDLFVQLADLRGQAAALLVQSHVSIKSKNQEKEKRSVEAMAFAAKAQRLSVELRDVRGEASCLHAMASAHDIVDQHMECIRAAEDALDLYLDLQDPYAEGFELCCIAQWFVNHGRLQLAVSYAEDALEILRKAPKPSASQELRALQLLSQAHEQRGDQSGVNAVHESLKRFQDTNNQTAEAAAMDMLLRAHCDKGEFQQALDIAARARMAFKKIGDEAAEANVASVSAGLHLKLHMPDEALKLGYEVLDLVRKSGSTKQKSDLMMTLAQAYLEKQQPEDALDMCNEMQHYFSEKGDVEGEAEALLAAGSLHVLQEDLDQARDKAVKAQLMLSEEGLASGEGRALRLLAEIYAKQEQHKAAIRAGERSRALLRGEENPVEEASMLFLVAQESVQLAVIEGARVGSDKPLKKHARDALDKAEKSARTAIKLCTENEKQTGITEVLGSSMCSLSQVHMLRSKYPEALKVAEEASQLFKSNGFMRNQGSACMLCADAYRALEKHKESQKAALEAVQCFTKSDPPDERGLEAAQAVLDALKQHLAPAPIRAAPAGGLPPQMLMQEAEEEGDGTERRVARPRPTGPALDIKNLHPDLVKKKILEVALSLTGADEEEIEADTPLMEAGLTSTMAVGLSDELKKELPGINLPVTLVFDYPSISAMTELILDGD